MNIIIIVGMTKKRVIGKGNDLPWHIAEDLKNFKKLTVGKTVIMGRKTFDSIISRIGKPLPERKNIVISSSMSEEQAKNQSVTVCKSLDDAISQARIIGNDAFIIGGASVYKQALPIADKMYISYIKKDYEGDVFFPEFQENDWVQEDKKYFDEFEFVVLGRRK